MSVTGYSRSTGSHILSRRAILIPYWTRVFEGEGEGEGNEKWEMGNER